MLSEEHEQNEHGCCPSDRIKPRNVAQVHILLAQQLPIFV
jgi:hypothetical protein